MEHSAPSEASVIVVPARDGARLERCLSAIAETTTDVAAEVVVVLNGAGPDACAVAREHPRTDVVVESPVVVGFAAAANLGRRHASAPRLVYVREDTVVHPGTVRRLLDVLDERPQAGACGPLTLGPDGRVVAAGPVMFADGRSGAPAAGARAGAVASLEPRRSDYCTASALAVRAEALDSVSGFEEAYYPAGYTDLDLGLALRRSGWEVWFEPSVAVVGDPDAPSLPSVGFRAFCHRRNRAIFVAKWQEDLAEYEPLDEDDLDGSTARAAARAAEREPRRAELPRARPEAYGSETEILRAYVQHLEYGHSTANGVAERHREELARELDHEHLELAASERERARLTAELERTHAAYAELEQHRSGLEAQLEELDRHVRESAAANERLTAEVDRLRERERELDAILSGGWWRLRGRLEPMRRLTRRAGSR